MKVSIALPRLKIDAKEIIGLWGGASVFGYTAIRKLGWDEDSTSLAVQSLVDLKVDAKIIHLVGDLNVKILCQATGISETDIIRYSNTATGSFEAFSNASVDLNAVFLIVDNPHIEDPKVNAIFTGAAIAICSGPDDTVKYEKFSGSGELTSILGDGKIFPDADSLRVKAQQESQIEIENHIFSVFNMRLIRRIKPMPHTVAQSENGYSGLAAPFMELGYLLEKGERSIQILSSDTLSTSSLCLDVSKNKVEMNSSFRQMSYSQFMQREQLPMDPGTIAQGAYISAPVYESNFEARYRLRSRKCTNCESLEFPPRRLCKECGHQTEDGPLLSSQGEIYAFTHILKGAAPTEFDYQQLMEGEYGVAVVEFPEGPKVITQLSDVDLNSLQIGDKVKMVFRRIYTQDNKPRYGYKFTTL